MGFDGRLLARARGVLEERRRRNDEVYERRLRDAYARAPGIRAIDEELRATMSDLVRLSLSNGSDEQIEDVRLRNLELQEERLEEIRRAGFPADFLEESFMCRECRDTGYIRTEVCGCLLDLYKKEQTESLSSLLKLGDETFDSFSLSYYDDAPSPETGVSPRRGMEMIYEICVEYSRKFGKKSMNLFFNGAPGLGKTFLSACIARVVAENGYSVVYDMAASVFSKFEDAKFQRTGEFEDARAETRRYLECELLILDDLGTEMTTVFTVSALYELINTRLVTNRKTIVSSNLSITELHNRYTQQIMSRLEGEFQVLTFRGDDIRRKKNAV